MGPEEEFELHNRQNSWRMLFEQLNGQARQDLSSKDARRPKFRNRNRYADVSPYDHSRVRLQRNNIDYINASLVMVPEADRAYILTQGPLKETAGHFWLMVWEQNSHAVIMLNRIVEKDQIKCYPYYPVGLENDGDNEMVFNDVGLKVTFVTERHTNYHFTTRVLQLQDLQSEETREVLHFHYTAWGDFRVPESPDAFLEFLFAIRQEQIFSNTDTPPVIHCSAGIGRSGTICLVDTCLVLADKNGGNLNSVNVLDVLLEMRQYRMGLIQTPDQLRFSYQAIIEGARHLFTRNGNIMDNAPEASSSSAVDEPAKQVNSSNAGAAADSDKEIDDTLDEFSKMLSDYVSDTVPSEASCPSSAQAKLESLFMPPDKDVSPVNYKDLPTVDANPDGCSEDSAPKVSAEDAARAAAQEARRLEREQRKARTMEKIAIIKQHQHEAERQLKLQPYVIGAVSVALAVLSYVVYRYVT